MTAEMFALPAHTSHSQLGTWLRCGRQYELERKWRIPSPPAWYFLGGSAFHLASEDYDHRLFIGEDLADGADFMAARFTHHLDAEIADALSDEPDMAKWRAGGRKSKEWPDKETEPFWRKRGEVMARAYHDYRQTCDNVILELPDGSPAIEMGFTIDLDGVIVKGAIDRIEVSPEGMLGVVDIKSGSSTPDSDLQLGLYAVALEELVGARPTWGAYFKARDGKLTTPSPLDLFTRKRLSRWYRDFDRARNLGVFLPTIGYGCKTCGVKDFCPDQAGPRAHEIYGEDY